MTKIWWIENPLTTEIKFLEVPSMTVSNESEQFLKMFFFSDLCIENSMTSEIKFISWTVLCFICLWPSCVMLYTMIFELMVSY